MMTVPLIGKKAAGRVALIDDEDYELVTAHRWKVIEQGRTGQPPGSYAIAKLPPGEPGASRYILMHKLITGWTRTDHINRDGLDNQRHNLRRTPGAEDQHRLTNVDHEAKIADCTICGPSARVYIRIRHRRGRSELSVECMKGRRREGKNCPSRGRPGRRRDWLRRKYGISRADYDRMLAEQGGCCAICGKVADHLFVDHDHQTGRVRGLLCPGCNTAIGLLRDDAGLILVAAGYVASGRLTS